MFHRLGQFVHDRRWAIIAAWALAAAGLHWGAPSWSSVAMDGEFDQLPPDTTTVRATRLNAAAFPNDRAKSQFVVILARAEGRLTAADRQFIRLLAGEIERLPDMPLVDKVWTEETPVIGAMLKSPNGRATRIVVPLSNDFMVVDNIRRTADIQRLIDRLQAETPAGLEVGISGAAAVGGDMLLAMSESLRSTDVTTIVMVTVALVLIYRSPWLVVVPLASIALAATVSIDLLALLAGWSARHSAAWPTVRIYTTTQIFVIVLLFGAGTDFCLFLIARFRELRAAGAPQREAVAAALARVGGAVSASAMTTILGLAMMGFADFGKFKYSGPAIAVSLVVALAVCLTLAPALLATRLGAHVPVRDAGEEPSSQGNSAQPRSPGQRIWSALADWVMARPATVLIVSVAALCPAAWLGLHAPVTYDMFSELSPQSTSRRGGELLKRDFPPGESGPLIVLACVQPGALDGIGGRNKVAELTKQLHDVPGVAKVRSLYSPLGEAPGRSSVFSSQRLSALTIGNSPVAREAFVATLPEAGGDVTRLFVALADQPFSAAAVETLNRIDEALDAMRRDPKSAWREATFEMLGPTAGIRDLQRVTLSDRTRIEVLVAVAVLVVILVLLRRPLVCLYLIATVLFSFLVTLGMVGEIFRWIYGESYPGIDWKTPVFLFVILVAAGQDYNIYLVTRVFEEQRRLGPLKGLREAMIQTGGIITSCGVIMAATFGSMIAGSLRGMVELGTALSLGILLDTFVVRTVLAPAFLALLAQWEESKRPYVAPTEDGSAPGAQSQ